jgi:hypothetical protein
MLVVRYGVARARRRAPFGSHRAASKDWAPGGGMDKPGRVNGNLDVPARSARRRPVSERAAARHRFHRRIPRHDRALHAAIADVFRSQTQPRLVRGVGSPC